MGDTYSGEKVDIWSCGKKKYFLKKKGKKKYFLKKKGKKNIFLKKKKRNNIICMKFLINEKRYY
jgi:hypothetical protein